MLNKNYINYNLKLGSKIKLSKNYIISKTTEFNLYFRISYIKRSKKIYLAGFDGFAADDPFNDETQIYINNLKKIVKILK